MDGLRSGVGGIGSMAVAAILLLFHQRRRLQRLCKESGESNTALPSGGSRGNARRSRFKKREGDAKVICAPNDKEYRKTIDFFVGKDDIVLELGCQRDATTQSLLRATKRTVIGVDICRGKENGKKLMSGSDMVGEGDDAAFQFIRGSVGINSLDGVKELGLGVSVVYVDLTVTCGNDMLFDGIALIEHVLLSFSSTLRYVVIKSKRLACHACRLRVVDSVLKGKDPWAVDKRDQERLKVLCAVGVQQYRSTITFEIDTTKSANAKHETAKPSQNEDERPVTEKYALLNPGDRVLEIGCHFGITTNLLHARVHEGNGGKHALAVGVDIGRKALKQASSRYPAVSFLPGSAWQTYELLRVCPGAHAIYIDIGGVSGYDGLLEGVALLEQLANAFEPTLRLIVVKSRALRDHANRYRRSDEFMYNLATGATLDRQYF